MRNIFLLFYGKGKEVEETYGQGGREEGRRDLAGELAGFVTSLSLPTGYL